MWNFCSSFAGWILICFFFSSSFYSLRISVCECVMILAFIRFANQRILRYKYGCQGTLKSFDALRYQKQMIIFVLIVVFFSFLILHRNKFQWIRMVHKRIEVANKLPLFTFFTDFKFTFFASFTFRVRHSRWESSYKNLGIYCHNANLFDLPLKFLRFYCLSCEKSKVSTLARCHHVQFITRVWIC